MQIILLIAISTAFGSVATWMAYEVWPASEAWSAWGQGVAWKIDIFRLVVLSIIATILMRWPFSLTEASLSLTEPLGIPRYVLRIDLVTILTASCFVLAVVSMNFALFPAYFRESVANSEVVPETAKTLARESPFRQIYVPYFIYFFYALFLWCGVILPVFLQFFRGMIYDCTSLRRHLETLEEAEVAMPNIEVDKQNPLSETKRIVNELTIKKDAAQAALRVMTQRYFPAILLVFVGHATSVFVMSGGNTLFNTSMTDVARSQNSSIVFIYAVLCSCGVGLFAYMLSRLTRATERIGCILVQAVQTTLQNDADALDHALSTRDAWIEEQGNIFKYAWAMVVKTRHVYVPLGLAIATLVLQFLVKDNVLALFPEPLAEWVRSIFLKRP